MEAAIVFGMFGESAVVSDIFAPIEYIIKYQIGFASSFALYKFL